MFGFLNWDRCKGFKFEFVRGKRWCICVFTASEIVAQSNLLCGIIIVGEQKVQEGLVKPRKVTLKVLQKEGRVIRG